MIGSDIILDQDLKPHLIELNSWPNMQVPYGKYKLILIEFFSKFLNQIVLKKLKNEEITETEYFCKLNVENISENSFAIKKPDSPKDIPCALIFNKSTSNGIDIIDRMNDLPITYSIYDEVKITDEIYKTFVDNKLIDLHRYKLRKDQVSMWRTHFNLWNKMVEDNVDKLLIMDERCNFVDEFKYLYEEVLDQSSNLDYDILYIGYSGVDPRLNKPIHLLDHGNPRCLHSYIVSLKGAKKLIEAFPSLDYPLDELMGRMFYKRELKGYRSSLLLTYQKFQVKNEKYGLQKYK